jgi:predicted DNA-binding transcriptional regulator YafY
MRNTSERRQAILEFMCERRHETISNLAFEFEVSERTMRYDVQILSISYPIYTATGNRNQGGGVHVVDGYYLGRKYLKPHQKVLLEQLSTALAGEDAKTMCEILKTFTLTNTAKE